MSNKTSRPKALANHSENVSKQPASPTIKYIELVLNDREDPEIIKEPIEWSTTPDWITITKAILNTKESIVRLIPMRRIDDIFYVYDVSNLDVIDDD